MGEEASPDPETLAPATSDPAPTPTEPEPRAITKPASRPAAAPPRGRWRRERGSQTLAPTRPRATAGRGRAPGRLLALLALVLIGVALYAINETFQPLDGEGRGAVGVSVPEGADAGRIGEILEARGVVDDGRFFSLNATLTRRRGKLRPGDYTLPRRLSNGAAIEALIRGPKVKAVETFNLSIPEGRSARETARRLKGTIDGDYLAATRSPVKLRRARRLGLPRGAKTLEGYLFPATYELPRGTTATELVDRQLAGFADNTAKLSYSRPKRRQLTRHDVLIIASMIEREVQLDRERRLVAAVIYNRLREGIPLGIDATIRYATNNWTRPIRVSELEQDGPYNSRTRRGLPPTPIGNPGLASIRAATRPASVKYLYYVVKPGSRGAHAFSSTDAQFQRDVARYQQAREDSGGQAP